MQQASHHRGEPETKRQVGDLARKPGNTAAHHALL
jgi:hypothetical protein